MTKLNTTTKVRIWGSKNAWSLSKNSGYSGPGIECVIELEIEGNEKSGYHLIMTPQGYFTADTWHETLKDALEESKEVFGVGFSDWEQSE